MNVRFFAGTKAEYLSLPTPRNPLGLYFCEDTKELFWADRLLTDGIRVVPTFADLPKRAEAAAEGVVYYVTETRNGYVLSPDRSEWLQTIYAPATDVYKVPETEVYNTVTTVGAVRDIEAKIYKTIDERIANIEIGTSGPGVKAIYFAGRKLDVHDDGTYHIDRLCALDALGFKIPEGQEDAEIELVTKEYVDELLAKIPGSDIDLSDYVKQEDIVDFATKEFVKTKIAEAELAGQDVDLSAYYTKSETEAAIKSAVDAIEVPDVSSLATKKELQEAINSIEHPTVDLEGYATEQWVNTQGFAKEADIPQAELFIVDFGAPDFTAAFEAYNSGKLLLLTNAAPDTSSYAIMNYVRNDIITFTKFLMSRSGTYGSFNTYYLHNDNTWELAKEVKLNKVEANVGEDSTSDLRTITIGKETYRLDGYATTETVNQITQSIENIQNTYVTNETLAQNYITQEEIANTYVTEEHIKNNYVTNQYITENYTTTQQLEETYVTNTEVTELVTNEVTTVVSEQIENKVTEVIEKKIEDGNLVVNADAINYDTW